MIDQNLLPVGAPNIVLDSACSTSVSILLNLHRNIDEHKLTTANQVQNMVQDMVTELELIKEN